MAASAPVILLDEILKCATRFNLNRVESGRAGAMLPIFKQSSQVRGYSYEQLKNKGDN